MNPQLNKVFSKLAKEDKKTELASEKVELGAIQDLDKLNSKIEKSIKEFNKAIGNTKKAEKDLGIKIPSLSKYQKSADLLDKLMRNA